MPLGILYNFIFTYILIYIYTFKIPPFVWHVDVCMSVCVRALTRTFTCTHTCGEAEVVVDHHLHQPATVFAGAGVHNQMQSPPRR